MPSSSEHEGGGWPDLPPELLLSISRSLTSISDYLRFRAVCSSWRSSAPSQPRHLPPQLPWLLSSSSRQNQDPQNYIYDHNFHTLPDAKIHSLPLLPQSHQIFGSSDGHLVLRSPSNYISLLNPITGSHHPLPFLATFPMSPFFIDGEDLTVVTEIRDRHDAAREADEEEERGLSGDASSSSRGKMGMDKRTAVVGEWSGGRRWCRRRQ